MVHIHHLYSDCLGMAFFKRSSGHHRSAGGKLRHIQRSSAVMTDCTHFERASFASASSVVLRGAAPFAFSGATALCILHSAASKVVAQPCCQDHINEEDDTLQVNGSCMMYFILAVLLSRMARLED